MSSEGIFVDPNTNVKQVLVLSGAYLGEVFMLIFKADQISFYVLRTSLKYFYEMLLNYCRQGATFAKSHYKVNQFSCSDFKREKFS